MKDKLRLRCPIVVEGKYDKIRLSSFVETPIFVLNGFSVFNDREKLTLLKRACAETGLILFTDSDRAGTFLRSKLKGMLACGTVYQVYAPCVKGKEKRKPAPSADGLLGIEGLDAETLYPLLAPFAADAGRQAAGAGVNRAMWYADGFSGGEHSRERREKLAKALQLPPTLSSGALLEAINLLVSAETYERVKKQI